MTVLTHRRHDAPAWSPYEQPHDPDPQRFAVGERVRHHDSAPWPWRVVKTLECDGLVEVDFGRHGMSRVLCARRRARPGGQVLDRHPSPAAAASA